MEINLDNIDTRLTQIQIAEGLERILHKDGDRIHFKINLVYDALGSGRNTGKGTASLTVPTHECGLFLLRKFGTFRIPGAPRGMRLSYKDVPPRRVLQYLNRVPYQDPKEIERKRIRLEDLHFCRLRIDSLVFGSYHRSEFSVEWKKVYRESACYLTFEDQHQFIRIKDEDHQSDSLMSQSVVILYNNIKEIHLGPSYSQPAIFFRFFHAPIFEQQQRFRHSSNTTKPRSRIEFLDDRHAIVAPYASLYLRVLLTNQVDLDTFARMREVVHLPIPVTGRLPDDVHEPRYTKKNFHKLEQWYSQLGRESWEVAFQCESLIRSLILDPDELFKLKPIIMELLQRHGSRRASEMLRYFSGSGSAKEKDLANALRTAAADYNNQSKILPPLDAPHLFNCHHLTFTPTTCRLDGPYPDQSNRVLRMFPENQHFFLRVNFADENRLQFRWDREVDGAGFVKQRIGNILHHGFRLGGRHFEFLGYSQSALRGHAVWFVAAFFDSKLKKEVSAASIRDRLGNFEKVIKQPARYGARLAQAFSATFPSVTIEPHQLIDEPDIVRNRSTFTDGIGRISPELADEVWAALQAGQRYDGPLQERPAAYQIRIGGYKGMVSVDHTLSGKLLYLRPSMKKFDAPHSLDIEIAKAFDGPASMALNRPLIMLLEDHGINGDVFLQLQTHAVSQARDDTKQLLTSARLLDVHALGSAFNLAGTMRKLVELGVDEIDPHPVLSDPFFNRAIECAFIHVMWQLKYKGQVPVPSSWALVGVADVHGYLNEGEVFACVRDPDTGEIQYLEGPQLIGRSPTVHPGDVQMVKAIGRPPFGSPFAIEPLANCVVFSVRGHRSLPSCLAGGDLDGDIFFVIGYSPLFIQDGAGPARYDPAIIKTLERASTIEDVAEFVVDYINSDVIGLVATTHLIIADQATGSGVFDGDCIKLADLHSQAVDFAKSGTPVPVDSMPRWKFPAKPDWHAKEIESFADSKAQFYNSNKAIGRMFRNIILPPLPPPPEATTTHCLTSVLKPFVERRVDLAISALRPLAKDVRPVLERFSAEMLSIRAMHRVESQDLTEEEVMIGTILARTEQPRKRADLSERMRSLSELLVRRVKLALSGRKGTSTEDWVRRAWVAWDFSVMNSKAGSKSFGWIALSSLFDALGVHDGELQDSRS